MSVSNNKVVQLHYTLKNDDGEVIDSSAGHEPLSYIHGLGNIIAGLEDALTGKQTGDKFSVTVEPAEGYGEFDDSLVQAVPKEQFGEHEVSVGQQFHADTAIGPRIVTVIAIHDAEVVINANHELAGETLHFDVEVAGMRDATKDELEHGHVHTEACNH